MCERENVNKNNNWLLHPDPNIMCKVLTCERWRQHFESHGCPWICNPLLNNVLASESKTKSRKSREWRVYHGRGCCLAENTFYCFEMEILFCFFSLIDRQCQFLSLPTSFKMVENIYSVSYQLTASKKKKKEIKDGCLNFCVFIFFLPSSLVSNNIKHSSDKSPVFHWKAASG